MLEANRFVFRVLSALREGCFVLPIAGMAQPPLPYALDGFITAEVITVLTLAQPPALLRQLTGPATFGRKAVKLSGAVTVIREEELPAITAFTTDLLQTHRPTNQPEPKSP